MIKNVHLYILYYTITCLTLTSTRFRLHPCESSSDLRKHLLGADILVNSPISIKTELVSTTATDDTATTAETIPPSSTILDIRVYSSTHRCFFRHNRIYLTFFITSCINILLIIFLFFYLYILFYTCIQMIILYFYEHLKLKYICISV